ncbi:uncharacterized protein LOC142360571 isoform X3 [Opisthocomus hoazin]|uniref:uncharacterized protein LOC142360571 isoform X3 n=1 Tax=Opisthocomus hoazin TaxID=30419 RepID=UPI003F537228
MLGAWRAASRGREEAPACEEHALSAAVAASPGHEWHGQREGTFTWGLTDCLKSCKFASQKFRVLTILLSHIPQDCELQRCVITADRWDPRVGHPAWHRQSRCQEELCFRSNHLGSSPVPPCAANVSPDPPDPRLQHPTGDLESLQALSARGSILPLGPHKTEGA